MDGWPYGAKPALGNRVAGPARRGRCSPFESAQGERACDGRWPLTQRLVTREVLDVRRVAAGPAKEVERLAPW